MRRTAVLVLLVSTLLAGCASALTGRGTRRALPPLPPSGQVVFQILPSLGGFAPSSSYWSARPSLTVYGDGTAYAARPQSRLQAPWTFRRGTITGATLRALIAAAEDSRLFDGADFGMPRITDVGTTSVLFRPGAGATRRASAYALGIGDDAEQDLTAAQRANRRALRDLDRRFSAAVTGLRDWTPTRVDVASPRYPSRDTSDPVPWPGPELAAVLTQAARIGRCGPVAGTSAARLFLAARDNASGRWQVEGRALDLIVRGLLPGEPACPA